MREKDLENSAAAFFCWLASSICLSLSLPLPANFLLVHGGNFEKNPQHNHKFSEGQGLRKGTGNRIKVKGLMGANGWGVYNSLAHKSEKNSKRKLWFTSPG
eukprot:g65637.t1